MKEAINKPGNNFIR